MVKEGTIYPPKATAGRNMQQIGADLVLIEKANAERSGIKSIQGCT